VRLKKHVINPFYVYRALAYFVAFAALLLILIYGLFGMDLKLIAGTDFVPYFLGAKIISSSLRMKIYDVSTQIKMYNDLLNLPFVANTLFRPFVPLALIFVPLINLPLTSAYKVFVVANTFLTLLLISALKRQFHFVERSFVAFLCFTFWPVVVSIVLGQISILYTLVLLMMLGKLSKEPFTAGVFASLLIVKIQYLVILPFLLLAIPEKRKLALGFLTASSVLVFVTLLRVGYKNIVDYPFFLLSTENPQFGSFPASSLSLLSLWQSVGFKVTESYILTIVCYMVTLLVFAEGSKKMGLRISFLIAIILMPVFGIHFGLYDLAFLLVPMGFLLHLFLTKRKMIDLFELVILFFTPFWAYTRFSFMVSITLLFVAYSYWKLETGFKKAKSLKFTRERTGFL
jgi:hypothetical protein